MLNAFSESSRASLWQDGLWHSHLGGLLPLGQEYLLNASDELIPVSAGGQSLGDSAPDAGAIAAASSPAHTLIGAPGGLQFNLIWDNSVTSDPHWSAIESAVVKAAKVFTKTFNSHAVLNVQVGYGEVDGNAMGAGSIGQSESMGYVVGESIIQNALQTHAGALIQSGHMASTATAALQGLTGESFFITKGESKALGLISATAPAVDGYIGLSSSASLFFPGSGSIGGGQYDAIGVAAHELSEVMGRLGNEGQVLGGIPDVYMPLDIFRYTAPHTPGVHPTAGYLSLDNGATNLESFNDPHNGGDEADWATSSANHLNAFNAFAVSGVMTQVSATDLLELQALGFNVPAGHILTNMAA
jgi:hypothetical protein